MNEQQIRWSEEELLEIVRAVPLSVLKDNSKMESWYKDNGYNEVELAAILTVVGTSVPDFRLISVKPDTELTFGELYDFYERAQVQFIVIHRVNYLLHYLMIEIYELLDKEKCLKFLVNKYKKKAEEVWDGYESPRFKSMTIEAWSTFHDHMRITKDILQPKLDKVYEAIRDYMIRLGWRDIEVKARVELVFLLCKVDRHSFRAFFKEFEDASGADFSKCFENSDLQQMVKYFAMMAESLGIKTEADKFGLPDIKGFDCDANVRVKWAWSDFIKDLQDNDLMDESALRAIELNPKMKADYERLLEEDDQKQLDDGLDKLSEKFKVTKQK
jgi:hypothetical protein